MDRLTRAIALAATIFATALPHSGAHAQSFDCNRATLPAEKTICASMLLARLDVELAKVYRVLLAEVSSSTQENIRGSQRYWIGERNACGDKFACLRKLYLNRITALAGDDYHDMTGRYDGPFGENEISISRAADGKLTGEFVGGAENYICGPVDGEVIDRGERVVMRKGGKVLMVLRRIGSGFLLPDNKINGELVSTNCGAQSPDLPGSFFALQ